MSYGIQISTPPIAGRALGALGKCDWNNPCSDFDRVGYRLEYYNLVFFEHAGTFNGQTISIHDFLVIIYQSWLQLIMLEAGQDKNGQLYQQFGMYGNKYFVAFGGSPDSAAKPGNAYYADCRFNCECNKQTPPFSKSVWLQFGYGAARKFFLQRSMTLNQFMDSQFNLEAELYALHWTCQNGITLNVWELMATMWVDPVGTFDRAISTIKAQEAEYAALREKLLIRDVGGQVIDPTNDIRDTAFKTEAIVVGTVGVALLLGLAALFNKSNKKKAT